MSGATATEWTQLATPSSDPHVAVITDAEASQIPTTTPYSMPITSIADNDEHIITSDHYRGEAVWAQPQTDPVPLIPSPSPSPWNSAPAPPPVQPPKIKSWTTPISLPRLIKKRAAEHSDWGAFLLIGSYCLDLGSAIMVAVSVVGVAATNSSLNWMTYIDATYKGVPLGVNIFTGFMGVCRDLLNDNLPEWGVQNETDECRILWNDNWCLKYFGPAWLYAQPIIGLSVVLLLIVAPAPACFMDGRKSFSAMAFVSGMAGALWIAGFTMCVVMISRMNWLLAPYGEKYWGPGFYIGCAVTVLILLSLLIKLIGLARFKQARDVEAIGEQLEQVKMEIEKQQKMVEGMGKTMLNGVETGSFTGAAEQSVAASAVSGKSKGSRQQASPMPSSSITTGTTYYLGENQTTLASNSIGTEYNDSVYTTASASINSQNQSQLAAYHQQQQPVPPAPSQQQLTPSQIAHIFHSIPTQQRQHLDLRIQSQLASYTPAISNFVREKYPDADEFERGLMERHYVKVYREQIEREVAGWLVGQQGQIGQTQVTG